MANRIYHAFWLLFLYISWLFLLSIQKERPTDSYHTFLELTSSGSIVHFDHREARKGVLSFSCALPGDRVERPFLAVSGQKPSRVLADGREIPVPQDCEVLEISPDTWFLIPLDPSGALSLSRLEVQFEPAFLEGPRLLLPNMRSTRPHGSALAPGTPCSITWPCPAPSISSPPESYFLLPW